MKQVNSKVGGESLRIKMPKIIATEKVMVIGIDVCHAGSKSVVGFCATTNRNLTGYYSNFIINPKNQELVKKDLDICLLGAIKDFKNNFNGEMPTKIIIYRDGVGEQMRDQIIDKEVGQFKETLKPLYNQVGGPPPITLVVVNKRINQRMFVSGKGGMENPPPGSIIDSQLVEFNKGTEKFDFYMVPQ